MMRVALNFESVGSQRGGAEKYVSTLARSLAAAGHEVHIVAEHIDRSDLPAEVRVHVVRPRKWPFLRWLHPYWFAVASAREIERYRFDLVIGSAHVWDQDVCIPVHGCRRALLDNAPERFRSRLARAVWRAGKLANLKQWVYHWIERRQLARVGGPLVIVPSRRLAGEFRRWHDLQADKVAVVHLGVEFDRVADDSGTRETFRRWCGLRPDDVAVLFAARNYAIKGLEPLLESFATAARACPTARLLVCGSNRDAAFRRQVTRLGLDGRVQFLGFVKDLQECLAGADVVALPTFYDTCSLVVFEALGAGVPVITTRANGAAELVSDGINGYLIDSPWSTNQLANRLQRLILDARLRRLMGQQARIRAPALAIESSVRKTLATIGRLHQRRAA